MYVRGGSLPQLTCPQTLPLSWAPVAASLWGMGCSQKLQFWATTGSVNSTLNPMGGVSHTGRKDLGNPPLLPTPTRFLCLATQVLIFQSPVRAPSVPRVPISFAPISSRPGIPLRQSLGSVLGCPGNQVVPSSSLKQEKIELGDFMSLRRKIPETRHWGGLFPCMWTIQDDP